MTDERMALIELVEKAAEMDLVREMLSATGLAMDLPVAFPSFDAAKAWRRGRSTADVEQECRDIAASAGAAVDFVILPSKGRGGLPTTMAVFRKEAAGVGGFRIRRIRRRTRATACCAPFRTLSGFGYPAEVQPFVSAG